MQLVKKFPTLMACSAAEQSSGTMSSASGSSREVSVGISRVENSCEIESIADDEVTFELAICGIRNFIFGTRLF